MMVKLDKGLGCLFLYTLTDEKLLVLDLRANCANPQAGLSMLFVGFCHRLANVLSTALSTIDEIKVSNTNLRQGIQDIEFVLARTGIEETFFQLKTLNGECCHRLSNENIRF